MLDPQKDKEYWMTWYLASPERRQEMQSDIGKQALMVIFFIILAVSYNLIHYHSLFTPWP